MNRHKANFRFLLLLLLFFLPLRETQGQNGTVDWSAIKTAFQRFVEYPSNENADFVSSLLPENHIKYSSSPNEAEAINYIFDKDNFGMLERQVVSGNERAARLAFKLHSIADGAFSEELNIMLGALIRIDSKLFLRELKLANIDDDLLNDLLGNFGPEYVDRFKAQSLEINLRINALKRVKDNSLIKIRDKCIGKYRNSLSKVNKMQ